MCRLFCQSSQGIETHSLTCAASRQHLTKKQCSSQLPCNNCVRRHIQCNYASVETKELVILVDRGRNQTVPDCRLASSTTPSPKQGPHSYRQKAAVPRCQLTDEKLHHLYFFDVFVLRNNFTGKGPSFGDDVKQLAGLHSGTHLMNAMLSLGALQAVKLNQSSGASQRINISTALQYYALSISGLRDALAATAHLQAESRHTVLWTTLLLGLFEVCQVSVSVPQLEH